jgi:hypothetical protein
MASSRGPAGAQRRGPPPRAILVVPVVVAVALTLFAWPASNLAPRDLPVGVAGSGAAARAIEARLEQPRGAFDVHRYRDAAEARAAILDRDVYGAFVATPGRATVLTASAASAVVAQLLREAAGPDAQVRDVVPATADDPRGVAIAVIGLPIVIGGIVTGVLAGLIAPRSRRQLGLLVAGAVLAGLVAVAILQGWLGVIRGGWLANAGTISLAVLAIAATVAALLAWMGPPGIAVGAVLMALVGNPFSGIGSAPELLPSAAGTIGQLMPPGAAGSMLRSTAFFDGADAAPHAAVLVAWALPALIALAIAARRRSQ